MLPKAGVTSVPVFSSKAQRLGGQPHNMSALDLDSESRQPGRFCQSWIHRIGCFQSRNFKITKNGL